MKCLCCGKEIDGANKIEISTRWHALCVKQFFGTQEMPQLDLSEDMLKELAIKNSETGYTIPGVQKKLSLHLSYEVKKRLTIIGYTSGYILKPQTDEYPLLPENEYMIMSMAKMVGIKTVPFALIAMSDGKLAYITKRVDRIGEKKLAMEDFCQLDLRLTEDKYKGSYERCAKVIDTYSAIKQADKTELFLRIIFSYLVGNTDMHLKNFSLISIREGKYQLSPAYDMLSTKIVLDDEDDLALTLNGKNKHLRRGDFTKYAEAIGISKKVADALINRLASQVPELIRICNDSYLSQPLKNAWIDFIKRNVNNLVK